MPLDSGQSLSGWKVGVGAAKVDVAATVVPDSVVAVAAADSAVFVTFALDLVSTRRCVQARDVPTHFSCVSCCSRSCFPPTAPPTAAPTTTRIMTVATTKNVLIFIPNMMRGGRLLPSP